jgi:antitoxin (DNA-binding transcriptional repressor) of toxin-antitoxin stability system
MRVVTQSELRNNAAAIMDAVAAGETYRVTRDGVAVAELRPLPHRRHLSAEELVERHRNLLKIDYAGLRQEADELLGPGPRLRWRPMGQHRYPGAAV